jgi:hypothetical protein
MRRKAEVEENQNYECRMGRKGEGRMKIFIILNS